MGVDKSIFSFSQGSIVLGVDSTTVNIVCNNQSYSHRLATTEGTIATLPVGITSYVWSPTTKDLESFVIANIRQKTFNITVTLYTYNGNTIVGLDSHFLTITLSDTDGKPLLNVIPTDVYEHIDKYGGLVSGQSKLSVAVSTNGKYGATVGTPSGSFVGQSYTGSSMTFIPKNDIAYVTVQNYGDLSSISWLSLEGQTWKSIQGLSLPYTGTLSIKATDSRGFTSSYYKNYKILPYATPTIINSDVVRCDSNGDRSLSGTYVKASVDYLITSINAKNTKKLVVKYKSSTDDNWTSKNVALSAYSGITSVIMPNFIIGKSYDFEIILSDDFNTITDNTSIRTNGTVLEVSGNGESIILGDAYGYNARLRQEAFEVRKGITTKLKISDDEFSYPIPNTTIDCNSVVTNSKLYNMFVNGSGVGNYPILNDGWLETTVYSSNTNYRFQRYTTCAGSVYERSMTDGTWGAWGRQLRQFILYSNDGANVDEAITLSETVTNFEQLTIQFVTNDTNYGSTNIFNPNGKRAMLVGGNANTTAGTMYMKYKTVYINDNTITRVDSRYGETQLTNGSYNTTDIIRVIKVIGWR